VQGYPKKLNDTFKAEWLESKKGWVFRIWRSAIKEKVLASAKFVELA
jgi:hypothetical protein